MNEGVLLPAALRSSVLATVLFLWGDEDPNGGADIAHAFTASFPESRLELVSRAGQSPWIDEPDHIATKISAFLST